MSTSNTTARTQPLNSICPKGVLSFYNQKEKNKFLDNVFKNWGNISVTEIIQFSLVAGRLSPVIECLLFETLFSDLNVIYKGYENDTTSITKKASENSNFKGHDLLQLYLRKFKFNDLHVFLNEKTTYTDQTIRSIFNLYVNQFNSEINYFIQIPIVKSLFLKNLNESFNSSGYPKFKNEIENFRKCTFNESVAKDLFTPHDCFYSFSVYFNMYLNIYTNQTPQHINMGQEEFNCYENGKAIISKLDMKWLEDLMDEKLGRVEDTKLDYEYFQSTFALHCSELINEHEETFLANGKKTIFNYFFFEELSTIPKSPNISKVYDFLNDPLLTWCTFYARTSLRSAEDIDDNSFAMLSNTVDFLQDHVFDFSHHNTMLKRTTFTDLIKGDSHDSFIQKRIKKYVCEFFQKNTKFIEYIVENRRIDVTMVLFPILITMFICYCRIHSPVVIGEDAYKKHNVQIYLVTMWYRLDLLYQELVDYPKRSALIDDLYYTAFVELNLIHNFNTMESLR